MEWVSHVNDSCHIWTSHVTYEWVIPTSYRYVTSHYTHTNASCCIYCRFDWVMAHFQRGVYTWIAFVMRTNASCLTHGRVISHLRMSHFPHIDMPCQVTHTHAHIHMHKLTSSAVPKRLLKHSRSLCHTHTHTSTLDVWVSYMKTSRTLYEVI